MGRSKRRKLRINVIEDGKIISSISSIGITEDNIKTSTTPRGKSKLGKNKIRHTMSRGEKTQLKGGYKIPGARKEAKLWS